MVWHLALLICGQTLRSPRLILATLPAKARYPLPLYTLLSALCPGAHTRDPIHRDVLDISGRWAVRGREADIGAKIGAGEPLEKFGRASFGDAGGAVDDRYSFRPIALRLPVSMDRATGADFG